MTDSPKRSKWATARASLLETIPGLLGLLAILCLETGVSVQPLQATRVSRDAPDTRLIVVWIDSLDRRDLEGPEFMPRLHARMQSGLHGPVRACTDAMTIPCFTAMQVGMDRFSLFSLFSNFGGSVGLPKESILKVMQRDGLRIGYVGDAIIASAAKGVDWWHPTHEDDYARIQLGLDALEPERLDFLIIHLTDSDEYAHRHGSLDPVYGEMLRALDVRIDEIARGLRPTDHLMVLGDHGHLLGGQHSPGMDVPTYATIVGPRFNTPLARPMALTDFGSLWAAVFDYRFGDIDWLDQYLAGQTPKPVTGLPPTSAGSSDLSWWALILGALLALACATPLARGRVRLPTSAKPWLAVLAIALVALVAGRLYPAFRPYVYWKPLVVDFGWTAACGGLGAILMWSLTPGVHWLHRGFASLTLFGLPTIYSHGGIRFALLGLLTVVVVGFVVEVRAIVAGEKRYRAAALYVAMAAVIGSLISPLIINFVMRDFPAFHTLSPAVRLVGTLALAFACLALSLGASDTRARWAIGFCVGIALSLATPYTPPRLWIVPCILTFPTLVIALWRPRFEPLALALALPGMTFFHRGDTWFLLPAMAVVFGWVLWAHIATVERARNTPPWVHGVVMLVLIWLGLWSVNAVRANGFDFGYFFLWLSEGGNIEETWYLNTPLTVTKYTSPPLLGLLMYRRINPAQCASHFRLGRQALRIKLAVTMLMITGFMSAGTAGPFLTADVVQEGSNWAVISALLAWVHPHEPPPVVD